MLALRLPRGRWGVLSVEEWARRKEQGLWGWRDELKAILISLRLFAVPWIAANMFAGWRLTGGGDVSPFLWALLIGTMGLLYSHELNNWLDYIMGVDRRVGGSVAKPYTAAALLLPYGLISPRTVKILTIVFAVLAFLPMLYLRPPIQVWILWILGFTIATLYTPFFKPKGLGEVALFLGHGFGVSTFAYTMTKGYIDMTAISMGVVLGMLAATLYTLDQWQDVPKTDFQRRVRTVAELMVGANMKPSEYFYFAVTAVVTVHFGLTLMGYLPTSTLKVILLLPYFHLTGMMLDYRFQQGVLMVLGGLLAYPILMAL
jgi:1,4-dihydroxy-2-naphthoate octaprenyltransferase